ncbi:MAG: 2-C-methyl-D-erythritol 4-phosphate cytidylyltransferase, partial [Bacteroidota bacterium]
MSRKYAIIVAGGSGTRMKSAIPKQFLQLKGVPVLMHTLNAFHHYDQDINIILVLPEGQITYWSDLVKKRRYLVQHQVVKGGSTRFQSVRNGLDAVREDGLVAVHDGVRPLVSSAIIDNAYRSAAATGAAITVVGLKDSIRVKDNSGTKAVDRSQYLLVQTPQTFQVKELKKMYEQEESSLFTDDASVYESGGGSVTLVEG